MNRFFALMMAAVMVITAANAQTSKQIRKAQKEAKKEARQLRKDGWKVAPGMLPLDTQLERTYLMQYELDGNGENKFFIGDAMSPGGTYDGAKMQATELAKIDIAGKIQSLITALTESTQGNKQITQEQAVTLIETVQSSKSLIEQRLGRCITAIEYYKPLPNKTVQVRVVLALNTKTALENAKAVIEEQLREKGEYLHEELNTIWAQYGL